MSKTRVLDLSKISPFGLASIQSDPNFAIKTIGSLNMLVHGISYYFVFVFFFDGRYVKILM